MPNEVKRGLKALVFGLSQLGLMTAAACVYFGDKSWTSFGWGVTLMALMIVRFENRDKKYELIDRPEQTPDEEEEPDIDIQEMQDRVAQATMHMSEMSAPILDSAAGQRQKMIADGWSPTAAEQMASAYYQSMILSFGQGLSSNG
jgi:hypothetical protein